MVRHVDELAHALRDVVPEERTGLEGEEVRRPGEVPSLNQVVILRSHRHGLSGIRPVPEEFHVRDVPCGAVVDVHLVPGHLAGDVADRDVQMERKRETVHGTV